jgi:hypothetical protein
MQLGPNERLYARDEHRNRAARARGERFELLEQLLPRLVIPNGDGDQQDCHGSLLG